MSALSIQPTYPIFTETDGQPLEDGYIWIGTANLDPQTNPITVYWDAALTLPAAQPIRTQGGYPVNSGTPARLYVNSDYSIRVMDKKGSVVYSAPTPTERFNSSVISNLDASSINFIAPGGGTIIDLQARGENVIYVTDYANLAVMTAARDPGDPNSHLLLNFLNWSPAIQAALDEADARGGGTVILDKNTVPYYVQDLVTVKSNTTFIFDDWMVLADYNFTGGTLGANGNNITVINCQIDNSNIFAGGSGYNGIGAGGAGIKFIGGYIKNCARGNVAPADGGKGVQIEPGDSFDITISDMTFENCFMAMSTIRDFGTVNPYNGIVYNNIVAFDCDILFFVRQSNGAQSQTGLEHTIQLNNFYAKNCGAFEGVMQFSRASNVLVSNGVVVNDPLVSTSSLIRGNHANCQFVNIGFYGDAPSVVQLDASTYAPDSSQANQNNRYDIQVWGQVDTFASANIITPYRTLNNCFGSFQSRLDPAVAWFGNELRNGTSVFTLVQNNKTFVGATSLNYQGNGSGNPVKFSDLTASTATAQYNAIRLGNSNLTNPDELDWYEEGTWTPTLEADSGTGAVYTSSGTYTRVGRVVTVAGIVTPTNFGTLADRVKIGGLPFVNAAAPAKYGDCKISFATIPAINVASAIGSASNSQITFDWMQSGAGGDSVRIANIVAGSTVLTFSISYFAA